MVVGPRALEHLLERLEVLVGEEGGPVDAREHLSLGVPTPVGAGHRLELERLDALGGGRMGAAAEVGEGPVGVERDGLGAFVLDEVLDELDLVGLLLQVEPLERLLHAHLLAHERLVGVDVGLHRRLDLGEVRVVDDDAVGEVEVVVEAVLDGGADADLHARIELEHRGGEHMSGVVANERERLLPTPVGEDLELGRVRAVLGGQRAREVAQLTVDLDGQRCARQPRPDGRGGVGARGAVVEGQLGPVWQLVVHPGPDGSGRISAAEARSGVSP